MNAYVLGAVYAAALFFIFTAGGQMLIWVCAISLYAAGLAAKPGKNLSSAIAPVFMVVMSYFMNVDFYLFKNGAYTPAFWGFMAGLLAVLVFFYVSYGKPSAGGKKWTLRKEKPAMLALKALSAAVLVVLGYFFLNKTIFVLAYAAYAACFVQLCFIIRLEPSGGEQETAEPVCAHEPGIEINISFVFAAAAAFALIYRSYVSIMMFDVREPVILVLTSVFFFRAAFVLGEKSGNNGRDADNNMKPLDWIIIAAILAAAMYVRLKDFKLIPPGFFTDDVYTVIKAKEILAGRTTIYLEENIIQQTILPYWLAIMFSHVVRYFSDSIRAVSVMFGLMNVLFIYLFARELFNRRTAVISAAIMSVMFLHVLYSRSYVTWVEVPACATAAYYFYFAGSRKGSTVYLVLAGFFAGLSLYFYSASKAIPLVLAGFFILSLFVSRDEKNTFSARMAGFMLLGFTAVLTFYPVIDYILRPNSNYFGRIKDVNIFAALPQGVPALQSFASHIVFVVRGFFRDSMNNGIMSIPSSNIIDAVSAYFMLAGLAISVYSFRLNKSMFLLSALLIGFSGAFFSSHWGGVMNGRVGAAMPVMVVLMAIGIDFMSRIPEKALGRPGRAVSYAMAAGIFAFIALPNLNDYFVRFKNDPVVQTTYHYNNARMSEFVGERKNNSVFISEFYRSMNSIALPIALQDRGIKYEFIDLSLLELSKLYNDSGRDAVIMGEGIYKQFAGIYREYFPNAKIIKHWDYNYWLYTRSGNFMNLYGWNKPDFVMEYRDPDENVYPYSAFVSVEIPYEDISALYGLKTAYFKAGSRIFSGTVRKAEIINNNAFDSVKLEGLIEAPQTGYYSISAHGADITGFYLNGAPFAGARLYFLKGLNKVGFTLSKFTGGKCQILWDGPGIPMKEQIPGSRLIISSKVFGLKHRILYRDKLLYEMRDYAVNSRAYYYADRIPYELTVNVPQYVREWSGWVTVEETAVYTAVLNSFFDCSINVDGVTIYRKQNDKAGRPEPMRLLKGRHKILIRQAFSHRGTVGRTDQVQLLFQKNGQRLPAEVNYSLLSAD